VRVTGQPRGRPAGDLVAQRSGFLEIAAGFLRQHNINVDDEGAWHRVWER
jgi:hypothetical protein